MPPVRKAILGVVVSEDEAAVWPLDLHLGPKRKRVEGVLEVGAGEPGGQLDERLGGRIGVAEVVVERPSGRGDGDACTTVRPRSRTPAGREKR